MSNAPLQLSEVSREIVRLARRAQVLRRTTAVSRVIAAVVVVSVVCAVLDGFLRFPGFLRAAMLGAILCFVVFNVRRVIIPALKFHPTAVDIALRIERMRPELTGRLASAVEFDLSGASSVSELASRAVADAQERSRGANLGRVLRYRPTTLALVWLTVLLVSASWYSARHPATALIACQRIFTPWSEVAWPSRTAVESLIADAGVAARGLPFGLKARLSAGDPELERVRAQYRVIRDGVEGEWMEVILSRQPSGEFERLVDADGDRIEFRFMTSDATTPLVSVRLVTPPAIAECTMEVLPPEYAERVVEPRHEVLGDGLDSQAIVHDPILVGSLLSISIRLTRPVPFDGTHSSVRLVRGGMQGGVRGDVQGSTSRASGDGEAESDVVVVMSDGATDVNAVEGADTGDTSTNSAAPRIVIDSADPTRWTMTCRATHALSIVCDLIDSDGIRQSDPAVFSFETVEDRSPSAAILEPTQDESVVVNAKVTMRAQSRDDLEIRAAGIEVATRLGSAGDDSLIFDAPAQTVPRAADAEFEDVLDIEKLSLHAGDSIVLRGYAEDFYISSDEDIAADGESDPGTHGRVKSAPRTLRIVAEEEFERQIRATFAGVRRDAMRLDDRQAKARDALEQDSGDPTLAETQGAITEGLGRARESIEQATSRLKRNGRDEGVLADLAQQAEELMDAAQAKSSQASDSIRNAAQAAKSSDASGQEAAAKAAASQQDEVREELEDLVGLLNRDEDAWIAQRRIDALANRVRQLTRETEQAASRSTGETREQLPAETREELDALGDRQEQAAKDAEKVAAELRERAKSLEEADPKQAKALSEAAKAIEEGRVREELEQAAQDASENRLEQSKDAQSRAGAALAKAAQALNEDHKVRAEELARLLETLVESITRLLNEAEPLAADVQAVSEATSDAGDIAREAIALPVGKLSQNTRGVASDARAASREAARVARLIDGAAGSLAGATGMLRASKFKRGDASAAMDASIKAFNDALAAAEQAADRAAERAEEEKREELLAKYRELLERQAAVRALVAKIVPAEGATLARRELMESRRLGTVQEELRTAIEKIRTSEPDVQGSDALVEMHDTIDDVLIDAKTRLSDGEPLAALPAEDEAVGALAAIVEALDENAAAEGEDPFGEKEPDQGEGGGGGGGQPPAGTIPPIAEIKILRAMQQSLAQRTRAMAEQSAQLDSVARAQQVANLAAKQQRIVELGQKIADKLAPPGNPTLAPTKDESGSEGDEVKPAPTEPESDLKPDTKTDTKSNVNGAPAPSARQERATRRRAQSRERVSVVQRLERSDTKTHADRVFASQFGRREDQR